MNKLKFKTFTWPSNPAVFREQWERNPQYTKDDTGNNVFIGMSLAGCTITGEGSFQGAAAYSDFLTLRALFLDGSPGQLVHPVWGDIYCYFTGLELTQEPREDYVAYRFTFRRAQSNGVIPKI